MKIKTARFILTLGFIVLITAILIFLGKTYYPDRPAPERFGFGKPVSTQEVAKLDIDIRPDGKGLPAGQGTVLPGKLIYTAKCASCHAADGRQIPGVKLPGPPLVSDTLAKGKPKTIGNYWPYATTLFDYLRRTMPYNAPGSLTDAEVYSLTAYLLNANQIIKADATMNAVTLPKVVMPAKKLFITDTRRGGNEVK